MAENQLTISPVGGALGAEVAGIDLRQPVTPSLYEALRAALVEHQVLFFRDQDIEPQHQKALAELFGPLQSHPAYDTVPGYPEVAILESTAEKPTKIERWHTDMTFRGRPPMGTMLRARYVPAAGGDTQWSSMTAAYDALSPAMQEFLRQLTAVHDFRYGFRESLNEPGGQERLAQAVADNPPVVHPLIRKHPESGRRLIFVNELFTTHICELTHTESRIVLDMLFEHIRTPEFCCRFRWRNNDIAFWDNRSTQHKPVNDYFPAERRMERITIDGDIPYQA